MSLCKTEGCENEAVLLGGCADCFNEEYDNNHRPDKHRAKIKTVTPTGDKEICSFCNENREVHSQGKCLACYMRKYRKESL